MPAAAPATVKGRFLQTEKGCTVEPPQPGLADDNRVQPLTSLRFLPGCFREDAYRIQHGERVYHKTEVCQTFTDLLMILPALLP
jgi:hypothetical protein